MNREILFRAKAINREPDGEYRTSYQNGDWVYGLVEKLYNEKYDLPAEMRNTDGVTGIEVDYTTLGQFTRLCDKNGVKIFEGDIVFIFSEDENALIKWEEDTARFVILADGWCSDFDSYYAYDLEVIGNIHDSPELLGGDSG